MIRVCRNSGPQHHRDSISANGRKIRTLNIVDDATRECSAIEVDTSISGIRVGRVLNKIALGRPLPERIVVDNGPEFTSKALDQWAYENGVELRFIRLGRPSGGIHRSAGSPPSSSPSNQDSGRLRRPPS
jgi:transposase InsO family protein